VDFLSSIELIGLISFLVKILFLSTYKNLFFAWDATVLVTRLYYRMGLFPHSPILRQVHKIFQS